MLAIQDTTELNFPGHVDSKRGFGRSGNGRDIGLFIHPTVAVDADSAHICGPSASGRARWSLDPAVCSRERCSSHSPAKAGVQRLGIADLQVTRDPVCIATEGALWGAVAEHGFLRNGVIVGDDAGRFDIGLHALCWVHAERLVQKLDTVTDLHRAAQQHMRALIWWFYADLKAFRLDPSPRRRREMRARFDRIFARRTGFALLDRLLARLHANKPELLMVLDRPDIPLHTNGSERDICCQVIKRKISGGTRSDAGRDCRDAFLGLLHTCAKLGVGFRDHLADRLGVPGCQSAL